MQRVSHSFECIAREPIRIRREKISCTIPELADEATLAIIITGARPNEVTESYHVDAYIAISALELAIEREKPQHIIQKMLFLALSLIRITAYDLDRIEEGYRRRELSFKDSIYRIKELNRRRDDSDTVLHLAEDPLMMKAFLSAGASPNATTNDGSTPLHRVTERLRSPIAEVCIDLLIGAGAAVNAKNNLEQSPLHLAADKIELVAKLLSIPGICVNVINRFNKTPLDYAGSDPDIVLLLKAHGAVYGAELRCCIS